MIKKKLKKFQRSNLWIRINGSYAGFFLAFSRAFKWYFDVSCDLILSIFVGGVPSINGLCWTVSLGYLCAWSRHTEQNISPSSYFNQGRFTFHAVLNCLSFFGSSSLLELELDGVSGTGCAWGWAWWGLESDLELEGPAVEGGAFFEGELVFFQIPPHCSWFLAANSQQNRRVDVV